MGACARVGMSFLVVSSLCFLGRHMGFQVYFLLKDTAGDILLCCYFSSGELDFRESLFIGLSSWKEGFGKQSLMVTNGRTIKMTLINQSTKTLARKMHGKIQHAHFSKIIAVQYT